MYVVVQSHNAYPVKASACFLTWPGMIISMIGSISVATLISGIQNHLLYIYRSSSYLINIYHPSIQLSNMGSGSQAYDDCMAIRKLLGDINDLFSSSTPTCNSSSHLSVSRSDINKQLVMCTESCFKDVLGKDYGKPMLWIGVYIAFASLFCVLAMTADLFHGFKNKKLWFPSKYLTLNVASIMMITTAMKLPVDLNDPMLGWVDQFAKLSSLIFMSTMMTNLMPSLASMENKELFENVIGLLILVVTIVVNVLIQIQTGVLDKLVFTYIYIGAMLYLLVILTSLALAAPVSKKILEIKYQAANKMALKDVDVQRKRIHTVEELIRCVRKYSIMAGTSSPQFVMATTPLCSAAGVICISSTVTYFYYVTSIFEGKYYDVFLDYYSDYKWSMLVIFIVQFVGIVVGTIALLFRCFAPLSFKLSLKWCKKYTNIFKVERYWTQKLSKWMEIDLVLPLGSHALKAFAHNLTHFIIHVCVGLQKVIVVSCKTISLIPIGIVIIGVYCVHCLILFKGVFFAKSMVTNRETTLKPDDIDEDVQNYALQLEDELELGTRTLKCISKLVDHLIQKAEKQQPNNLLKLMERFTGFEEVLSFDSDEVQQLLCVEPPNGWSLPVVTLTCIAITLPNVCKDVVDSLCISVCEGLQYTFLVEESLNNVGEAISIHKAARILWHEVDIANKWLGNILETNDFTAKTPIEILKWFSGKAEETIVEINKNSIKEMLDESQDKLIAANSMYRITQTIMLKCHNNATHIREEQLFAQLSDMIVSIVVACLTNLPRVIAMKCQGSTIEQREASVQTAAKILGNTKKIIERLQVCELPSLEPDQMAFIDEWRVYLKQSIP
ncbi:hypothetical protein QVD17_03712 [Tagetes erecta]|uniref:Uncharacterized protein n=1 Tax=Tagetes erecta TaxID=13708 RepID=A0AAD8PA67_TARER|nr:hypothetical protein QVD17_03712 [Tagetes erecta]